METKILLEEIVKYLEDKKAQDINVINIDKVSILADAFVICSGTSTTHIKALADEVDEKLKEKGIIPLRKEGYDTARWILLDFGNVVVHIFHQEDREYYDLDGLWIDGDIKKK